MMKKTTKAMLALMLTTLTACEKSGMDGDSGSGQVANSLLQVRTRGGGVSDEEAELSLLSPNEKEYTNLTGLTLSVLESAASIYGTDGISGWRPMTYNEALLLQAAKTALGIDGSRKYLFDDNGTVKQMQMSNATVSIPSSTAAYVRPVATVTISKE